MSDNNNISISTHSDIAVSTRIRLARNLRNYPFPCAMKSGMAEKIVNEVESALSSSAIYKRFKNIDMSKLSKEEAVSLVERHLISPDFLRSDKCRHLFLLDDGTVSIMINEEDHIRIQAITSGMDFEKAYDLADKTDTLLSEKLLYAYDDKLGYLTQCPTNLGTGMRASVMLHLPALQKTSSIERIAQSLSKLGITIRGSFGEGSGAIGALYQLSNQVTLGLSEQTAINNLQNVALQIINQERTAANTIVKNLDIVDSIYRSLGTLKYARLISHEEAMKHISNIRMALSSSLISTDKISSDKLNELILKIQPATLMQNEGKTLNVDQRDEKRAFILREAFSHF